MLKLNPTIILFLQYEKLVLSKTNKIVKVEFTTEGRKVPLYDIRMKMLEKQKPKSPERPIH